MPKKSVTKKKTTKKKRVKRDYNKSLLETNKMLVDNFVNLQKVMVNMAEKFEDLSDNITKLLQLFEISARSFAEKLESDTGPQKDKEFLDKLNVLLEQNKTIAKGLTLMEEKFKQRVYGQPAPRQERRYLPSRF